MFWFLIRVYSSSIQVSLVPPPCEEEFGRHGAVLRPAGDLPALTGGVQRALRAHGGRGPAFERVDQGFVPADRRAQRREACDQRVVEARLLRLIVRHEVRLKYARLQRPIDDHRPAA